MTVNNQDHLYYSADVSDYQKIHSIQQELKAQHIFPDVIVHNAAGNFLAPFQTLSENAWKRIIDIVLHGAFNVYHVFGKEMISQKKKGKLLNILNPTARRITHIFDSPDLLDSDEIPEDDPYLKKLANGKREKVVPIPFPR